MTTIDQRWNSKTEKKEWPEKRKAERRIDLRWVGKGEGSDHEWD